MSDSLLVIEGRHADIPSFATGLQKKGFLVHAVTSGSGAVSRLEKINPSLVVVNAASLRSTGLRICQSIRDKNGKLVGMLSQADLTNALRSGARRHPTVSEVMTPEVFTVYADGPALVAAAVMAKYDIHRVAVWDAAGALTGMVTSLDLVKALARGARFDVEVAARP
jgi:CBS domain-containing protein